MRFAVIEKMELSEEDKIYIFINLIMDTDTEIYYYNNKLVVFLSSQNIEKIQTYIKNMYH